MNLEKFIQQYALAGSRSERKARVKAIEDIAVKEANRLNSGIYGPNVVDRASLKAKLNASFIWMGIRENLAGVGPVIESGVDAYNSAKEWGMNPINFWSAKE